LDISVDILLQPIEVDEAFFFKKSSFIVRWGDAL